MTEKVLAARLREYRVSADVNHPVHPTICDEAADRISELEKAADFALAVLWGSDGDRKGATRKLEKVLGK